MSCITKIKHESKDCTAEKGLQIFYDDQTSKYTGYCFSCAARGKEAYVRDPYNGQKPKDIGTGKSKEEKEAEVAEVRALGAPIFSHRGIPADIFKRSYVKLAISEYDGKTPFSLNFPMTSGGKLLGFKTIMLDKKAMWATGTTKGADLFNWEMAKKTGAKRLYITEGEYDCLALQYMLEQDYSKAKHAVCSVPTGASGAAQVIGKQAKEISSLFPEVVLVFDNDEAGYNAVREVQKVLPTILEAPHLNGVKDANEALQKGQSEAFLNFVKWKSRKPHREGVVTISQAMERGMKEPTEGKSLPLPTVSKVLHGKRGGEATCVAGGVGCGKTVVAHEFAAWSMKEHSTPVFAALLEESNIKTCWNIAAKIDSIPYNRPEVFKENREQYYETMRSLEDKLLLWDSDGSSSYRFDLPEIISAVRINHSEYGCEDFYLDNMTRLVDQMPTTEANEFINKYSSEIANLAAELDVHITVFSHLNPPKGKDAKSHEEGGEVYPSQITGSRGIMRSFPNIIGFERNKYAEPEENKNNSFVSIIKSRDYGDEQKVKTQYNPATGRLKEFDWEGDSLY